MANHKSSEKRITRNAKKAKSNHARKSKIRTTIKKFLKILSTEGTDKKAKQEAFKEVESQIARGAGRGVMHKKTASRQISRLAKKAKAK